MVRRDITNDVTLSFSSGVGKNRNETKMAAPISIDIEIGNDEKSFFGKWDRNEGWVHVEYKNFIFGLFFAIILCLKLPAGRIQTLFYSGPRALYYTPKFHKLLCIDLDLDG